MLHKILNRRKNPRFHAKDKTYIVFKPFTPGEKKVQIIDISEGGCGFIYTGYEDDVELAGFANLVCGIHNIENINFSKIRDNPVSKHARKAGVEFNWLGSFDKAGLKEFVKQAALCKCG